jgi:two-component system, LytTR family, sensor histidine kinase AlgZ
MAQTKNDGRALFLPDFCAGRAALALVLIVELVAVVLALARQSTTQNFWVNLASLSMFLLWIGLGSAVLLCRATPWLTRQSTALATVSALTLIAAVVALVSEITFRVGEYMTGGVPSMLSLFPQHHAEFLIRNVAIGLVVGAVTLRYFYVSGEWKRSIELEAQSRIHALQARIRPHFLFNSMNTIAELTRSDPAKAEQAVEDLADLFRANLSDAKQRIRLGDELEVARVYQRIEQLRLGSRLTVDWQVDGVPMDALVPSLLLQPLLENAIYHGIERLPNGGVVSITAKFADDTIELAVANPLADNSSKQHNRHSAHQPGQHQGNKLALDNIEQRLQLAWPGRAKVTIDAGTDRYCVTLTFPYSNREES